MRSARSRAVKEKRTAAPAAPGSTAGAWELGEIVERLAAAIARLETALAELPAAFGDELEKRAGTLGTKFGREAQQASLELQARLREEHDRFVRLLRGHEGQFRNQVAALAQEVLRAVHQPIAHDLRREIESAAHHLRAAADDLCETVADRGAVPRVSPEEA